MFGLSLFEFIIIIIVATIVIKPKDMPEVVYFVAKLAIRLRRFLSGIKEKYQKFEDEIGLAKIKEKINQELLLEDLGKQHKTTVNNLSNSQIFQEIQQNQSTPIANNQDSYSLEIAEEESFDNNLDQNNRQLFLELRNKLIIDDNVLIVDVYGQSHLIPQGHIAKNKNFLELVELQEIAELNCKNLSIQNQSELVNEKVGDLDKDLVSK
jgi:Sec-independent protein translocase protein TatA